MRKFNYIAPFNPTGYGVAATQYGNFLSLGNNYLHASCIGNIASPEINTNLKLCIDRGLDPNLPSFCFWHLFDIPNKIPNNKNKKIGYTTFELDVLRPQEIEAISKLDMIGTASLWGAKVLKKYVPEEKVFIIRHGGYENAKNLFTDFSQSKNLVDIWSKMIDPVKLSKETLILSTAGKFESRKGHPELMEACINADFPILLVAFVFNPFIKDGYPYDFIIKHNMYPSYTKTGIKTYTKNNFTFMMLPPTNSRIELHSALSKAHFFISPSKAEGWNLPLFEMMSCGMPCITTNTTAHTEYVTSNNIITIPSTTQTIAKDDRFFDGFGTWLNVTSQDILTAITLAKSKQEDTGFLKKLSSNAYYITSKITWKNESLKIQQLMNSL